MPILTSQSEEPDKAVSRKLISVARQTKQNILRDLEANVLPLWNYTKPQDVLDELNTDAAEVVALHELLVDFSDSHFTRAADTSGRAQVMVIADKIQAYTSSTTGTVLIDVVPPEP